MQRRRSSYRTLITAILLVLPRALWGQGNEAAAPTEMAKAAAYAAAQDWANAAKTYQAITAGNPSNAGAWFQLGYSLHMLGEYSKAVEAYRKSSEAGMPPIAIYNIACSYALMNQPEKALEALAQAVDAGFGQRSPLTDDPDLVSLHQDSRFKELSRRALYNAMPCLASPEYRQFDFWVGEWDVFNPQGLKVGTNSIQRILGDCALMENWTSAAGSQGKSFNFYNADIGKWHQTWIDDRGGVLELNGTLQGDEMRFEGSATDAKGTTIMHRLTFFKLSPDAVRQFWQQSTDGGATWTVAFDGKYVRRKGP